MWLPAWNGDVWGFTRPIRDYHVNSNSIQIPLSTSSCRATAIGEVYVQKHGRFSQAVRACMIA